MPTDLGKSRMSLLYCHHHSCSRASGLHLFPIYMNVDFDCFLLTYCQKFRPQSLPLKPRVHFGKNEINYTHTDGSEQEVSVILQSSLLRGLALEYSLHTDKLWYTSYTLKNSNHSNMQFIAFCVNTFEKLITNFNMHKLFPEKKN